MLYEYYAESNGYNSRLNRLNNSMPIIEDPFFRLQVKADSIKQNGEPNFNWMDHLKCEAELDDKLKYELLRFLLQSRARLLPCKNEKSWKLTRTQLNFI